MGKCNICGKKIQPYFDVCSSCYNKTVGSAFYFSDIGAKTEFMQSMGISVHEG